MNLGTRLLDGTNRSFSPGARVACGALQPEICGRKNQFELRNIVSEHARCALDYTQGQCAMFPITGPLTVRFTTGS